MIEVEFLEAAEVRDGDNIVIQKFRLGQVVELSNASARHWISRNIASDVQATARDTREAKQLESGEGEPKAKTPKPAKAKAPKLAKAKATDGTVNPTSPKRGRGRPRSA